jgi:hypothetical protein
MNFSRQGTMKKGQLDKLLKLNDDLLAQKINELDEATVQAFYKKQADKKQREVDTKKLGLANAQLAMEKQAMSKASAQAGASGMLGQLQNKSDLIGLTGKDRELAQAMQTLNATNASIENLASGGGELKRGQRAELRGLAAEIYKKTVSDINKSPVLSKKATKAGSEAGFERVGLTRSRLSGKGGSLEIIRNKQPTAMGQERTNDLLSNIADSVRGKSVAVAG